MNKQPVNCLGVVLAGGKSSRMGQDKALLTVQGESLLLRASSLLKNVGVDDIMISGKTHGEEDIAPNTGPLGGIYTAIANHHPKALLILPVDLPLIDVQTIRQLKTIGELTNRACYYQHHYLPLYLPNSAFCHTFFATNYNVHHPNGKHAGYSVRALLQQLPHKALPLQKKQALFNANTPQDWQQVNAKLAENRISHG
ncbi:molybdenum cofactor guanylyltransferase [Thalassotalea sediminis]|uniref:molybdenum cofactor guanylyltransferase n=1 Tax=Thalassotalea sediminis TaxID=1759089 RepID=UPI0025735C2D|nr:molybdenum cofactor guanylyltransferase [Thalassotalea sediminis]